MISLHSHTDRGSNLRLIDALAKVEDLIQKAADLQLNGLALTEHESTSSHIFAQQKVKELKEKSKIPNDFQLILGNELYLIDSLEESRDNYQSGVTKFPHFLILAKDSIGHLAIRKLSSQAYKNSFYTGLMERVPTTKAYLEEIIKEYPNKLIGSSACLGSESSIHILNGDYDKAKEFLKWCADLFGENNFYLELQPSRSDEQRKVNHKLIEFSKELDLPMIITTDVHYLRPEDAEIHAAFLNSKNAEREVMSFYESCYLHTKEEIYTKLDYLDESIITEALLNTLRIGEMIEDYSLEAPTEIPKIDLPEFEVSHIFKDGYDRYPYIKKMAFSDNEQDRYLIHLVEKGFIELIWSSELSKEEFHETLARINLELGELWEISIKMNQSMGSYYVTVQEIIKIAWADDCGDDSREEGTLVGVGRGSASGYILNYLLKITAINPLKYGVEMPHWRHLEQMRGDVSALDIDIDVSPHKRPAMIKRMKERFSESRIAQVATFGTEGSKSAIQTACRGLGYDLEIGQYISSMIPFERGENYTISDCLEGNEEKDRKPVKEFIREIEKYPKLKETALKIEGVVNKRSVHAGGLILTNKTLEESGLSIMTAPGGGGYITQNNLDDCQAAGTIKYDLLSVKNIAKIQESLYIMLDEGLIEWKGTLRKTFDSYIRPEKLDLNDPEIYELLGKAEIPDLFQFDTKLATQALSITKPTNLIEMAAVNSLMRLMGTSNESPVDTFARFKNDISLWYGEMKLYGLNEHEIKIMEKHLLKISGIADTQESIMLLAMDEEVANFDIVESNVLRKAVAKKKEEIFEKARVNFFKKGREIGTSENLLKYVWDVQISRQKSYSFSILHTIAYSITGIINIWICAKYSPIIWHTACLTINSGSMEVDEGEKGKMTQYGKIAASIGNLKSYNVNVELPLINSARFGFTPDLKNERIIFSLKGINSINDDIAHEIIKHRPYTSFDDFYTRMYETKIISKGQILKLIKAGSFNEFADQIEIMKQFLVKEVDVKTSLNGQNLPRVISLGLLDAPDLISFKHFYNFKAHISKTVHSKVEKPKDRIFKLDSYSQAFYFNHFSDEPVVGWEGSQPLISEKAFKKEYDEKMKPLMDMLNEKSFLTKYNQAQFYELWNTDAEGSVESWQMSSVSYYADKHELYPVDTNRYGISSFSEMPEEPIVLSENTGKNGRVYKNMQLYHIAGTVLEKTPNKNTITLLTHDNKVVTVKMYGNNFSSYNRQIKTDGKITSKSFFTRGNLLLVSGFRRGDTFSVKAERNHPTIQLITEVRQDGSIGLQSER